MVAEDFVLAGEHFRIALQSGTLETGARREALALLGRANLRLGNYQAAADAFNQLLADAAGAGTTQDPGRLTPGTIESTRAYFWLGQAYAGLGDCSAAIGAYRRYLGDRPDLNAYVLPRIATCQVNLGQPEDALASLTEAAEAPAHPLVLVNLRLALGARMEAEGSFTEAAAHYQAILELAETDRTRGRALFQAGAALLKAGQPENAFALFGQAVNEHPEAPDSYSALLALLENEVTVDEYQRGLVNFYSRSYGPALAAFERYVMANPVHEERVHLYSAWSYEALGNVEAALGELDLLLEATAPDPTSPEPPSANYVEAWMEKGELLARNQRASEAVTHLLAFVDAYPAAEGAPAALWRAAELAADMALWPTAAEYYARLATDYPQEEQAAEALFKAGRSAWQGGESEMAFSHWQQAVEQFGGQEYASAALLWLLKASPESESASWRERALNSRAANYYATRVRQVAADRPPFRPAGEVLLPATDEGKAAAESWLQERLGLDGESALDSLSAAVRDDGRWRLGEELWRLGLREEAKRELESLRQAYREDGAASYALALHFRDLGLYRSSILAGATVLALVDSDVYAAPPFLGRLVYPVYYSDLVLAAAELYGYDPLLQFALIRQESLFESFATSTAVAQGLSQVIPDTGAYIAGRLAWPDFENEDLYHPYVGVAFGAYYLNQQLELFDGNTAAALAAYNGGPGNAARWMAAEPEDLDEFLEIVDFGETRAYVRRIYVGQAVYRFLYGVDESPADD